VSRRRVFASESVTRGHPDKICDQVSDAIVDAVLYLDPAARVSAECAVASGLVFLAVTTDREVPVDPAGIARQAIREIGYDPRHGFDPDDASIVTSFLSRPRGARPAPETPPDATPASDQASVFGYACIHTPERMPVPIALAHRLARRLDEVRRVGVLPYLGPDGKVLVAVEFEGRRPVRVHTVVVNVQHEGVTAAGATPATIEGDIREAVIRPVLDDARLELDAAPRVFVNPGGAFLVGGPRRDAGLTGRKGAVDTYGGHVRHGGSALSGKDPDHIDRLGAYAARHVARNIVAARLALECEVHIAYAIGEATPLAASVETFGTGVVADEALEKLVRETLDLRPQAVVRHLELRQLPARHDGAFYVRLAAYGHFGRVDLDAPWEREDRARDLECAAGR
jgi:S-adenosylmethionine synthetase